MGRPNRDLDGTFFNINPIVSRMGRPNRDLYGTFFYYRPRSVMDGTSQPLHYSTVPTVTVGRHGWEVPAMTRIGHFMISALPGHGLDILHVNRMEHSIPVTDRTSHPIRVMVGTSYT